MLGFNKPYLTGKELDYIKDAVDREKLSGNGYYTQRCHQYLESRYGLGRCLLTQSCTDALEMTALLLDIGPGDEVILPSFTFVSTANAFVLRGATLVFADSEEATPNIDPEHVRQLITPRTKAIVIVHYAGVACDMDALLDVSSSHGIPLVEDAAQAIDATYKGKALGSFGDLACFSFHETKNIISGEGGMLVVNKPELARRAEVIWEKGTNRSAFSRGEVDKYNWIDVGSSFLPSEITAAFLFAQLEQIDAIQALRCSHWARYQDGLSFQAREGHLSLPVVPSYASNNAHMFFVLARTGAERDALMTHLRQEGVQAIFHYLPLHQSPFFSAHYHGRPLFNAERYAACILRLPLFAGMTTAEIDRVINSIHQFYNS